MRDLKSPNLLRPKANRRKRESQPRDWGKILHQGVRAATLLLSTLLVSGAALVGARALLDSDQFRIDTLSVVGVERLTVEEVAALSDIRLGDSIFDLDLGLIGTKIEENPWIKQVRVDRVLPREVVISVSERAPRAIINLGYLYYVDGDGDIFKVLGSGDALDFPVITGIERNEVIEHPDKIRARLREAVALLDELTQRQLFGIEAISEVRLDAQDGVSLFTYRGAVPVRLGEGGFGAKLDRLERIYQELEPRLGLVRYIDLQVADRVIVKIDSGRARARG